MVRQVMERKMCTMHEFAMVTGIPLRTVCWLIACGKIPHVRVGRRVLIPAKFLDELEKQAMQSLRVKG